MADTALGPGESRPLPDAGQVGDGRSDVYALATLAYKLFTGRLPAVTTFETPSQMNAEADEALDETFGADAGNAGVLREDRGGSRHKGRKDCAKRVHGGTGS